MHKQDVNATHERQALGLLTLCLGALYLWLAPAWVLGGDNPEFSTLSALGGVAHPSGYPLYVLYLRATSWLPGLSPAHTAALSTAVLGMLQVPVLARAARAWGAGALGSLAAAALYATAPLSLLIFTQAEVFALNGLLCALIAWVAAPQGPARGAWRCVGLGALAGLALSNHLSSVWMAPLGLYGAILGLRELPNNARRALAALGAVGALALALGSYLSLLWQAQSSPQVWGDLQSVGDVVDHFLRKDYGTFQLNASEAERSVQGPNLIALALTWWRALLGIGAPVAALGWWVGFAQRTQEEKPSALAWGLLLLTWLGCGAGFISLFNIDPRGVGLHVVERFHILPTLLLCLPLARGLSWLVDQGPELAARLRRPIMLVALPLLLALTGASLSLDGVRRGHSPAVELYLRNTLLSLPQGAVLISNGDHRFFGFSHMQEVHELRPDVLCLDWSMLAYGWYRQRMERRFGGPLIPEGPGKASQRMVAQLLQTGRPVMMTHGAQPNLVEAFPSYPIGTVVHLLPVGSALPDPYALAQRNQALYQAMALDYPVPGPDDGWMTETHQDYAQPWLSLEALFTRMGDGDSAARASAMVKRLAPWSIDPDRQSAHPDP